MTPKNKKDVRRKILSTAEKLFAQRGFDASGIEAIAKTAGITKSLIYYYFDSKDDILRDIFTDFAKKSVATKKRVVKAWLANPKIGVDEIIKKYSLPFMIENRDAIKIAFAESIKDIEDTPHLNIFQFFDENFNAGYEISKQMGLKTERTQSQMITGFFMFFAPLFSFIIFSDEWCDYYKTDMQETTDLFADALAKMYTHFITENTGITDLESILKRKPAS
ncbi:MAG: TetR/AcrR family transcriptional regulator [Candidatus Marinimicrobia bacterium]|nr:TetR/AcrR family transcriptional regulator [Candidatus Neomarinimicrobiota bacterium]